MAHIVTDKVMETTTTTGTGAIALGGAVVGFQDFDSQMANADTTVYAIKGISGASVGEWEVGLGTWNTGNTLSRTTIVRSSNANSVVTLSAGTKAIYMTFTPTVRQPGMSFTGALTPATSDLAALGSGSLMWSDLFLANGGVVNWNNGASQLIHSAANTLEVNGATLLLEANNAARPPFQFNPGGTLLVTGDGAMGMDATTLYACTDQGNPGYIPIWNFIRADATRTYTSNTSAQAIFNAPANGRLTIETGAYIFRGTLIFQAMSATSGNRSVNVVGGGTATCSAFAWHAWGADATVSTVAAGGSSINIATGSTTSVVPAQTGTALAVSFDGSFECTAAGTLIPQTTMVTAAASTLTIGSYMEFCRVGDTSRVSIGQWD